MIKIILLLLVFMALPSGITYLIWKYTKNKVIKYIPALIPLYFILHSIWGIFTSTEGMADLGYFLTALLFTSSFLGVIITAIILDKKRKY